MYGVQLFFCCFKIENYYSDKKLLMNLVTARKNFFTSINNYHEIF